MGEYTENFGFYLPDDTDPMSDVRKNVTDTFKKIEYYAKPTVIPAGAPLPQVGDYNIGDRVFRHDPITGNNWPSSYLLICKDDSWGWHWRPVQTIISPWITVPTSAIDHSDYGMDSVHKFQIALDSKGNCHWRGSIRKISPGIPVNTTITIFKNIPPGIRPNVRFMHTVGVSPVRGATGKSGYVGGRIFLREDGYSSFRFFNTNNGASQNIWFDSLNYNNSARYYYGG